MARGPLRIWNPGEPEGIGATSLLVNNELVLDYGVRFVENNNTDGTVTRLQLPSACNRYQDKKLKAILISHDHLDHLGGLPQLTIPEHAGVPIFISEPASFGSEVMLNDTLKIARNAASQALREGKNPPTPLFTEEELELHFESEDIELTDPGDWFHRSGYDFGFYPIGHNTGARCTAIVTPDGWPIFWTGDASAHGVGVQGAEKGVLLPDDAAFREFMALPNRVMITEATNGARLAPASNEELERRLVTKANEVLRRGGSMLYPAFANQRSGRLINILRQAMNQGLLPDTPIHVDGLARAMVRLQVADAEKLLEQGKLIFIEYDSKKAQPGKVHRDALANGLDPCGHEQIIVISSSADLRQGPSVFHASWIARDPKNAILFPGYLFPGSPAKEIYTNRLKQGFTIRLSVWGELQTIDLRCEVEHFELSAHDWQEALVERVRQFAPRHLVVHHCSWEAYKAFRRAVRDQVSNPPQIYRAKHSPLKNDGSPIEELVLSE